jgi:ribosomal protein L37AE/L43A
VKLDPIVARIRSQLDAVHEAQRLGLKYDHTLSAPEVLWLTKYTRLREEHICPVCANGVSVRDSEQHLAELWQCPKCDWRFKLGFDQLLSGFDLEFLFWDACRPFVEGLEPKETVNV